MDINKFKDIGEEAAKHIGAAILGKLADSLREATRTFNGFYENLRYQREYDIISEEEYYTRLEELRDRYFQKGTDNWVKYTKMIYEYEKKVLADEKKAYKNTYDDISDYAVKKIDGILKKQKKLAENLNSYGSFYNVNTVEMNGVTDQYYSLHDLSADIEAIDRYSRDIEKIKERAGRLSVDTEAATYLLSSIKEMDVEDALPFMSALLYADDGTFSQYVKKAFEKYNYSDSVAFSQYEEEFNRGIEDSFTYMKDKFAELGMEIPEEFYIVGSDSAKKFSEAFAMELSSQMINIGNMMDNFGAGIFRGTVGAGNVYNTTHMSYNINSENGADTVEQIKRYETVKRLAGIS